MYPHIRSGWYNPPRRRRHLMKEVLQWHMLYDVLSTDVSQHKPPVRDRSPCPPLILTNRRHSQNSVTASILAAIPRTAQLWRLAASREIVLAGFQQELYAPEEKPIAYWYLARVLDHHVACIEDLLPVVPHGTMHEHLWHANTHSFSQTRLPIENCDSRRTIWLRCRSCPLHLYQ